ncbi:MAG: hypothetical protein GX613_17605 [Chloroflexi bacterium]|nr:hypothetical protein [Chloroflexota bacterium]
MDRLRNQPVIGPLIALIERWPRLSAWIVLSVGCIALLVYEARDVGLTATNWVALIVATIAVAGLCIWIVSWEDRDDLDQPAGADKRDTLEIERHDA